MLGVATFIRPKGKVNTPAPAAAMTRRDAADRFP
jgi:hypothetical protein